MPVPRTPEAAPVLDAAGAPPTPATKSVRFVRSFRQYHKNDCCGFAPAYADQLIQKGVAVDVNSSAAVRTMVRK